jgi:hypothetical protein
MIQTIFGSPVVIVKIDNHKEVFSDDLRNEIIDYLIANKETCKVKDLSGINYVHGCLSTNTKSAVSFNRQEQITELANVLRTIGLQYTHLFTDKKVTDLKLSATTVNLNFRKFVGINHRDKINDTVEKSLSILFYPKIPTNSANLVFIHNSNEGDYANIYSDRDMVKLVLEEGTVVIFDNNTLHSVDTHNSNDTRMSIHNEFAFIIE